MSATELLALIGAVLLLQAIGGLGLAVRRRSTAKGAPSVSEVQDMASATTGAWSGWRDFRVVRRTFEDAGRTQCSFDLQPVDGAALVPFQPGQYLTFALKVPAGAAASAVVAATITRCYSLSDRPDPAGYRITVKRVPPPASQPELPPGVASGYFHDRVREGDVLQVKAPSGHFFIDPDASVPAVFIAGGIGITPMMSMLRWCAAAQPERALHLYYGLRNGVDHAFKQTLEALADSHPAFRLHRVYSRPGPDDVPGRDYQHLGYIDLELLRSKLPHGRHQFYVCGPPPMMQSLVPALRAWGVEEDDLHFEAFGPASMRPIGPATNEPLAAAPIAFEVRLRRSGRTLVWDGQDDNLLDFAERHGVAVDSGCRSGSCGTCETKLFAGRVHYADQPDCDIAKGHCLLCVGKPLSPLELDA